jgi:hypothetical protein
MFDFCIFLVSRVTGGELFEDIVAREFYSEADARYYTSWQSSPHNLWEEGAILHFHVSQILNIKKDKN